MPQPVTDRRACVFGAGGGIGRALVEQLVRSGDYAAIYAGARQKIDLPVINFTYDLTDEASIAQAAQMISKGGGLDLVIVATGTLHDGAGQGPEKSWRMIDASNMAQVFAINTIGPALIAKHFLPILKPERLSVFAALSAKVGSIIDNRLGGWHSYRASKAALNMLIRNFAIELKTRKSDALAVALHPGTVDTSLSKPFQRNLAVEQLFTPTQSAAHLLSVIAALTPEDNGHMLSWDGTRLPY